MAVKKYVPVVAVLNMKGGVGKTTLSSNVFRQMFDRQKHGILLLDLDPQFNLTQTLFTRVWTQLHQHLNAKIYSIDRKLVAVFSKRVASLRMSFILQKKRSTMLRLA